MNRRRIGKDKLIELRNIIFHVSSVKVHREAPVLHIDRADDADIPVENLLVVIIADLHHLIAEAIHNPSSFQTDASRIESLLQNEIQIRSADDAPLHGSEDLYVRGRHLVVSAQLRFHKVNDGLCRQLRNSRRVILCQPFPLSRLFHIHKKEIGISSIADIRHDSLVNPMGIHDNPAGLCLTENAGQLDDRKAFAVNQIPKYISCSDRGQLIYVSDQNQRHAVRHSLQQIVHQHDINHGAFINNQHIALQRVLLISLITFRRLDLKQAVDGLRLHPCRF